MMKRPSFRRALASSVMALVIAFYPGFAIVNADTTTGPATAPQATQPSAPQPTQSQPTSETPSTAPSSPTTSSPASTNTPAPTAQQTTEPAPQTPAPALTTPAENTPANPNAAQQPASPGDGHADAPSTGAPDTTDQRNGTPNDTHIPSTEPVATSAPRQSSINTAAPPTTAPNNLSPAPTTSPTSPLNNSSDASINGTLTSTAKSGDASVTQNTLAGNLASGDALAIANLFNLVQSSANFLNPGNELKTFNANIQGDVVGDLLLDPGQINKVAAANSSTPMDSLTVNNQTNAAINAKIDLDAQSGNATAASNTKVGDTTTGNADAIANVVNMINSTIGAGQSFMGAINIYGNLDGDILLPPGFLDTLLASNSPSAAPSSQTPGSSTLVSQTNNQSINNAINASATSGTATVTDNTKVGNIKTGDALTNLTVLNLSSSDVIGANNLLVFVNVLGKWYGVIMDAPVGTTAASLGGGITQNNSLTQAQDTTTRSTTNSVINNDINVRARSGDALVTKNTQAGNATTGNATASVNLANFIGSHLSLSDWFGVLFINVFGTWKGSFGIDTVAGGYSNQPTPSGNGNQPNNPSPTQPQVFRFVSTTSNSSTTGNTTSDAPYYLEPVFIGDSEMTPTDIPTSDTRPTVLASTITETPHAILKPQPTDKKQMPSWLMPVAGLTLGSLLLLGERLIRRRKAE